jgi:hypothetical protein
MTGLLLFYNGNIIQWGAIKKPEGVPFLNVRNGHNLNLLKFWSFTPFYWQSRVKITVR